MRTNRRDFLKLMAGAAAGLLAPVVARAEAEQVESVSQVVCDYVPDRGIEPVWYCAPMRIEGGGTCYTPVFDLGDWDGDECAAELDDLIVNIRHLHASTGALDWGISHEQIQARIEKLSGGTETN